MNDEKRVSYVFSFIRHSTKRSQIIQIKMQKEINKKQIYLRMYMQIKSKEILFIRENLFFSFFFLLFFSFFLYFSLVFVCDEKVKLEIDNLQFLHDLRSRVFWMNINFMIYLNMEREMRRIVKWAFV